MTLRERFTPAYLEVGGSAWDDLGMGVPAGIFAGAVLVAVRWNGFAVPAFTREQVEKVIAYIGSDTSGESATALYWQDGRLMLWQEEVNVGEGPLIEDVGPDEHGLFWPGAFGWTWSEVDADTLAEAGLDPGLRDA